MKAEIGSYLSSWSDELLSRANRVRNLIGEAHWLSDGHHKEAILRELLARYLPADLHVSRGFIKVTSDAALCSNEIDILVADPQKNPPLLREGDLLIVDATAALACLEVKTTFSAKTLFDSMKSLARTKRVASDGFSSAALYTAIVFFECDATQERVLEMLQDVRSQLATELPGFRNSHLPNVLSMIRGQVTFLASNDDDSISCKSFEVGKLSLALMLADLFGHIRRERGGKPLSGYDDLVEMMDVSGPILRRMGN